MNQSDANTGPEAAPCHRNRSVLVLLLTVPISAHEVFVLDEVVSHDIGQGLDLKRSEAGNIHSTEANAKDRKTPKPTPFIFSYHLLINFI